MFPLLEQAMPKYFWPVKGIQFQTRRRETTRARTTQGKHPPRGPFPLRLLWASWELLDREAGPAGGQHLGPGWRAGSREQGSGTSESWVFHKPPQMWFLTSHYVGTSTLRLPWDQQFHSSYLPNRNSLCVSNKRRGLECSEKCRSCQPEIRPTPNSYSGRDG